MPVSPSYRNQSINLYNIQLIGFYMLATVAFNGLIQVESKGGTVFYRKKMFLKISLKAQGNTYA